VAVAEARSPNPYGEALVRELRWVHDMIRRDLGTVRQLAAAAEAGLGAAEVRDGLAALATNGPLWQLKINCLAYCRLVHTHHRLESLALFPELRRTNPALSPVVDKLEADHAAVSGLLDDVDEAACQLGRDGDPTVRRRLVEALESLSADLLVHLRYEEDQIADTLRSWTSWPPR
jgi:hypothetical protein